MTPPTASRPHGARPKRTSRRPATARVAPSAPAALPGRADVVVVGGGAAGLMAAIAAAEAGRQVLLLEKNAALGRKILVSGNGRCNVTNSGARVENYHGENTRFLHGLFARFGVDRTAAFFDELGVALREERLGRIFPASNQARAVVDLLEYRMARLPIDVRLSSPVESVVPEPGGGLRLGVCGRAVRARKAILAAGGCSFPRLGTTGDGFDWARSLGHRVTPLRPALAPVDAVAPGATELQGIRLEAEVTGRAGGRSLRVFRGDLLFTAYGLSGPTVLAASSDLATRFEAGGTALRINLFPGQDAGEIDSLLERRWSNDPSRKLGFSFVGLLPARLAPAALLGLGLDPVTTSVSQVGREQRRRIAQTLTAWEVPVSGCRGWDEAEVTAGGVAIEEIDPRTLESRRAPGLYFCGEMLDVFGDWGGYNFQLAWTTGRIAGEEAAR